MIHPEWNTDRIGFQPFPYESYTSRLVTGLQQSVVDGQRSFLDAIDPATAHSELVDDSFIRNAIATLGGPSVFGIPDSFSRSETIDV